MLEISTNSTYYNVRFTASDKVFPSDNMLIRCFTGSLRETRDLVIETSYGHNVAYTRLTHEEAEGLISAIQYVLMKERERVGNGD